MQIRVLLQLVRLLDVVVQPPELLNLVQEYKEMLKIVKLKHKMLCNGWKMYRRGPLTKKFLKNCEIKTQDVMLLLQWLGKVLTLHKKRSTYIFYFHKLFQRCLILCILASGGPSDSVIPHNPVVRDRERGVREGGKEE